MTAIIINAILISLQQKFSVILLLFGTSKYNRIEVEKQFLCTKSEENNRPNISEVYVCVCVIIPTKSKRKARKKNTNLHIFSCRVRDKHFVTIFFKKIPSSFVNFLWYSKNFPLRNVEGDFFNFFLIRHDTTATTSAIVILLCSALRICYKFTREKEIASVCFDKRRYIANLAKEIKKLRKKNWLKTSNHHQTKNNDWEAKWFTKFQVSPSTAYSSIPL